MSDQQSPTVFKERYELHRRLARGGMSDVYLARDLLLDRPVAVKVLFPEYAKDATFVERFRREARAAARLTHGNIVAIYDWGEEMGTYFIAMEYVEGRSLSQIIRAEGPFAAQRTAQIATEVAVALDFAHRNGVVHRDVKPGNVMMSGSGQVKVADFGIAQAMTGGEQLNLTQTGAVMGTATYFSPEQAQGKAVDPRSDLYSLGCVIYEMLEGVPPFSGENPVSVAYQHVQERPVPPSERGTEVPPPLEAIVMKLLQKSPANRYATAEDLAEDLRRFLDGRPVAAMGAAVGGAVAGAAAAGAATGLAGAGAMDSDATRALPSTGSGTMGPVPPPEGLEPPERRGRPWLVAGTVAALAVLAVVLFLVGANLTGEGTDLVTVPTVEELPVDEARERLEREGFVVRVVEEANTETPRGIVFGQDPSGGSRAPEGSEVVLSVSIGIGPTEVPSVLGFSENQAISTLQNNDLLAEVERQESPDVPEGEVFLQDPPPGTEVDKGSVVTITISSGRPTVSVPEVAGQTEASAANLLGQEGFQVQTSQDFSDSVPAGQVIRTSPSAGTTVEPGSLVTIVVSAGPEPTTTTTTSTTTTSTTTTTTSTTVPPSSTSSSVP